jgi:RHS repeat-associated protein
VNRGRFRRPEERVATGAQGVTSDTYGYVGPTETAFETGASGTRSLLDVDGSRLAVKNGSTVSWVIFDLHGSVAALCPAGGSALSDAYRYDAWGQTIASWSSATPAANPWKYRGLLGVAPGQTDLLYDMVARDYSPATGTFTSLDSVQGGAANPLTMNRYVYALANPATLIDPDGHFVINDGSGVRPILTPSQPRTSRSTRRPRRAGGGSGSLHVSGSLRCSAVRLNCSLSDFRNMSLGQRVDWLESFQATYDSNRWLNGLTSFVRSTRDIGANPNGWFGVVDARLINNIQSGYLGSLKGDSTGSKGVSAWSKFWTAVAISGDIRDRSVTDELNDLAAKAELKSLTEGRFEAESMGKSPTRGEMTALLTADTFRLLQQNRPELRQTLGGLCGSICDLAKGFGVDIVGTAVDSVIDERDAFLTYPIGLATFAQTYNPFLPPIESLYGIYPKW